MRDICVAFGGVHAVQDVTVDLHAGEVVGLVGGNGAGKTTLIRALSGAHPADSGEILIDGQPVAITQPARRQGLGIETIYQTLALADNVDAAANVFLGRELKTRIGSLDDAAMESATRKVMGRLNPNFKNFKTPVKSLSGGQRQSVAIARAIHFNARILIMDEPTAALGPAETAQVRDLDHAAEVRRHRHLPDQPRHPRRLRPGRPDQRHAPRQARRHGQQGRRDHGRGPGHDHHGQAARARSPRGSWPSSTTDERDRCLRLASGRAWPPRTKEDPMGKLDGRVAMVTGASRGIGAAVARSLAAEGVRLGLASRSGGDLGIEGSVARPCDVRDPAALEALVAEVVDRFGRFDILVVNAGVGAYGPFLDLPADQLEEMIDVNVKGAIYAIRAALPHLVKSDAADIVTVASEAGRRGLPYEAVYCASKFAQVGLTRALDHELRERGVRCTNVCPGGVATDFAMGRGRTPDMPELEGMMAAQDVAEVVLFVLTRPRNHRILEVALRPVTETSWG